MIYLGSEIISHEIISYYSFGLRIMSCYKNIDLRTAEIYDTQGTWLYSIKRPVIKKHDIEIKIRRNCPTWGDSICTVIIPYLIKEL